MSFKDVTKETAYSAIKKLVERFSENYESYKNQNYNETQTRIDFINPFFKALGWDMDNEQGFAESYREVKHEDKVVVGENVKNPDYCFTIQGQKNLFYLEAKKPSVDIKEDIHPAYQVRRYGWTAGLLVSIVTDFEELAVYDTSVKPNPKDNASVARIKYITYDKYLDEDVFDFIWETFSKEKVLKGSFDKYVKSDAKKRGTSSVDAEFIKSLDSWREELAKNIASRNKDDGFTEEDINYAVQNILDRVIFLRICEDRGVEPYGKLQSISEGYTIYPKLVKYFLDADDRYNSGLFRFKKDRNDPQAIVDDITPKLTLDDKVLKQIIKELYYPECPYQFSVMPVEILGHAYEQFLGKVIRITKGGLCKVEEKPEVRKAGGVYYTPQYIVEYIVKNTVGKLIEGKKPKDIEKIKIIDPACGSGSFLIGAYKYLLNYHLAYYTQEKQTKVKNVLTPDGKLTTNEKKRILLNNIYGVDIDSQAVEVTKLSLLLKAMEGETEGSIKQQMALFHERVLPTLDNNIKCGNSLIGLNFYEGDLGLDNETIKRKIKPFDWNIAFPEVFKQGGFDAVIGNPPYETSRESGIDETIKVYLSNNYITAEDKFDYYTFFIEKAVSIINKHNGISGFITPSTYLLKPLSVKIRKFLLDNTKILELDEFKGNVFSATVPTCIILFSINKSEKIPSQYDIATKFNIKSLEDFIKGDFLVGASKSIRFALPPNYYFNIYADERFYSILEKTNTTSSIFLGDLCEIYNGIQTGDDKQYVSTEPQNAKWQKVITGSDINRYYKKWGGKYVLYQPEKLNSNTRFDVFKTEEKIIIRQTANRIIGAYDDESYFSLASTFIIKQFEKKIDYKALLGILNSNLFLYLYRNINNEVGRVLPQIKKKHIFNLPIKIEDTKTLQQISKNVSLLLDPTYSKEPQNFIYTDGKIDELVYKLYDLTDKEIKTIKDSIK